MTVDWWWAEQWESSRQGSIRIAVGFDGGEARGILFDIGAPKTVEAFRDRLPLAIPVIHVAWSGDMVMGARRLELGLRDHENFTRLPRPGDLAFDPKFDELTLTYGTAECRLPSGSNTVAVFGQFTDELSPLADFCRRRRFEGVAELRFRELK
jgi:uncharacterized protein DUF3830